MEIENQLILSYYKELTSINDKHAVKLIQHIETGHLYVLKTLNIYDINVFLYLKNNKLKGIPQIQELFEDDNKLYVIEEYISGITLREKMDNYIFKEKEAVNIILKLCKILKPLHDLKPPIIHRDIKPSNIIITSNNNLYLVDFNSAKIVNKNDNRDTILFGTQGYAAPEQYGFSQSQVTTDIYALAVLLNEMLTDKMPNEKIYVGHLTPIIKKCLSMDAKDRYQSIDELINALDNKTNKSRNTQSKSPNIKKLYAEYSLPGFRSSKISHMLIASAWYAFIIYIACSLNAENTTPFVTFFYKIMVFSSLFLSTLWFCNYLNIWDKHHLDDKKTYQKIIYITISSEFRYMSMI